MKWTPYVLMAATLVSVAASNAQSQQADTASMSAAAKAKLIKSALSAAPSHVAANATVALPGAGGQMTVLRQGTNGFTCIPDAPDSNGVDPMCIDEEGMKWAHAWMAHEAKPGNSAPGLIYMLAGGSDISATDPWAAKTDHWITSPPHWMILWPFDAAASGLPTTPKKTGTWIMWAGTPYAHLMVNQVP